MTRCFALDFDGTLVSCRDRQVALALTVARELSLPEFDAERFWESKQHGASTRHALLEIGWAEDDAERVARVWGERVEHPEWLKLDRPAPTMKTAIERIRAAGLRPVVLTARRDPAVVRRQARAVGAVQADDDVFVVSPADATQQKGERLREMRAIGFVGDTESDAGAARLASVPFAAVTGGQRAASFLREKGIEVHADVLAAVEALL